MLIRIVRMTFREESVHEFLDIFNDSRDKIRHFPGCSHLELHRDANDPNTFCTYSHWESQDHLDKYRNSELFGSVWPATKALFANKPFAFSNHVEQVVE